MVVSVFVNCIVPGVACGSGLASPLAPKLPVTRRKREISARMERRIRGTRIGFLIGGLYNALLDKKVSYRNEEYADNDNT